MPSRRLVFLVTALGSVLFMFWHLYAWATPSHLYPVRSKRAAVVVAQDWQARGASRRFVGYQNAELARHEICSAHVIDLGGTYLVPFIERDLQGTPTRHLWIGIERESGSVFRAAVCTYGERAPVGCRAASSQRGCEGRRRPNLSGRRT